jgi:hypothetical protein
MEGRNYKAIKEGTEPSNTLPSVVRHMPVIQGDQYEEAVRAVDNMIAGGLLNTPVGDGLKCRTTHHGQRRMNGVALEKLNEHLTGTKSESDGDNSRLSPLFTEEMMGFPLMWTALPFLSENGEPKPSKPTATPSSPK